MSVYRSAVWFLKGLQEYTEAGYEAAARRFATEDLDVDLSGRSFMVTGANSGIGRAAACELAKRGGTVHMVCRNKDRAEAAKLHITEQTGNKNIHIHLVDLSNPKEVRQFVEVFQQTNNLNVLVNNAGCMINQREVQQDGLEKNFAMNTLGTYILTTGLIPVLKKSPDPRVVTVSSGGMLVQKLNVSDLQFEKGVFDGTMAYAQCKRQQVVLTELWATENKDIHFSCMHPGWADTPAVRSSMPDFYEKMKTRLRTEAQGADTVVWLAVSKRATKHPSGLFFQDREPVNTHLPLASTRSSRAEEELLRVALDELLSRFGP